MTADSQRIAARSATTHGTFARDVVLPRLGEDPQAYELFLDELTRQLAPKNLLEQHYAEKIAAASWRLRRLHRWQAQVLEDTDLSDADALHRLTVVMRYETTLHRQIDTSIKMLARELPKLFEGRVREDLLRRMSETERTCKDDPYLDQWLTEEARKRSALPTAPPSLDLSRLDTAPDTADTAPTSAKCQNEPAPCHAASPVAGEVGRLAGPEGVPQGFCQNEPIPSSPTPPELGAGGRPFLNPLPREGEGRRLAAGERGACLQKSDLQKCRDWATMKPVNSADA